MIESSTVTRYKDCYSQELQKKIVKSLYDWKSKIKIQSIVEVAFRGEEGCRYKVY